MKIFLFLLLFYTGVVLIAPSLPWRYVLIQEGKTWSDAQAYCRAKHIDLAMIKSNNELEILLKESKRQQFSSSAWIGLYNDVNSWRWSFGNEPLGSMKNWYYEEPNNAGGHEECGVVFNAGWNDACCTGQYPSFCFDESKTGTDTFIYISNSKTWHEAQSYCRQYHTDLATVRDTTEDSAIRKMINSSTWFGMFRDSWKWVDQSNASINIWSAGKPNNALGNENCGYLNNSQVADSQCSDIMPFFCYSEFSKKQIIRVKVRSIQDVTDPAVEAAILEQIKQKLKDHGMAENTIMKWREQPNGKVFRKERVVKAEEKCNSNVLTYK